MNAALTQLASGLKSSILGAPSKAVITLHTAPQTEGSQTGQNMASLIKKALSGATGTGDNTAWGTHRLEVQYNPSSIVIQANADSVCFRHLQQNMDDSIPNSMNRPPSVVMSVELLFDDMTLADSFMVEKFTSGVSAQTVSNVAGMLSGKVHSVQSKLNAFVGLMQNDLTRIITFQWADMSFTGEVTEVQVRYTMFSTSGRPVRGTVRLNITQQVDNKEQSEYWNKAFDQFLPQQSINNGKSVLDKAQNLINIGF